MMGKSRGAHSFPSGHPPRLNEATAQAPLQHRGPSILAEFGTNSANSCIPSADGNNDREETHNGAAGALHDLIPHSQATFRKSPTIAGTSGSLPHSFHQGRNGGTSEMAW